MTTGATGRATGESESESEAGRAIGEMTGIVIGEMTGIDIETTGGVTVAIGAEGAAPGTTDMRATAAEIDI